MTRPARILAATEQPVEVYAAPLEAVGRSLGWELGAVWELGPGDRLLRCVRTWRAGKWAPEFEALSLRLDARRVVVTAAEALGGSLELTSPPGGGTCVRASIPT